MTFISTADFVNHPRAPGWFVDAPRVLTTTVPGWPVAFRGSAAVAAGLTTWGRLRGGRYLRLFPDIYIEAGEQAVDLLLRSLAAYRLVEGRGGVLSGYSAARLLDADCAPRRDVPAEVTVPGGGQRAHPDLLVHRDQVAPGEIVTVGQVRCTSALRSAYDLARQEDHVQAVVAVDRLANTHRFNPDLLLNFAVHYRGSRGNHGVAAVLGAASPYSGSPMETRLRLVIVTAALPRPQVQWAVQDPLTRTAVWLDLAWPRYKIGIEYEGEVHTRPEQVRLDTARFTRLVDAGWRIYRYTKDDILSDPTRITTQLRRAREQSR